MVKKGFLKLRGKLLLFFIIVSTIPLIIINIIWFNSARNNILNAASLQIQTNVNRASDNINNYFSTKLLSLIIHSQTQAVLSNNIPVMTDELNHFLVQDSDIQSLTMLNKDGKEIVKVDRNRIYPATDLIDQSQSTAYKITTFVGGDRYISPVFYDESHTSLVTLAIPVVSSHSAQSLQTLSTSSVGSFRQPGDIAGVLVETVKLDNLWQELKGIQISKNGYLVVFDDKGTILSATQADLVSKNVTQLPLTADPLQVFSNTKQNSSAAIRQGKSGQQSLISRELTPLTNWGIVAISPLNDTLAQTNQVTTFTLLLVIIMLTFILLMSLWLTSTITTPIRQLAEGSKILGGGNFEHRIKITSGDEIEELGDSFNYMAANLKDMFHALQMSHLNISTERNKLSYILESITDALLAVDLQNNIILFNKAAEKLTGYRAQDVLHKHIDEILFLTVENKRLLSAAYAPFFAVKNDEVVYHNENLYLKTTTGKLRQVTLSTGEIVEGQQANIGAIITLHDLTAEHELEKMKLDFVSLAAHELRTPLTTIRSYLSVVFSEIKEQLNAEQKGFFQRIDVAANQLQFLVESLLDVSRIERGEFNVNLEPIQWEEIVAQVIEELTPQAAEKQLVLQYTKPSLLLPKIMADRMRLREVLVNLVMNAIKYTKTGSITVSLEQTGSELTTHVSDTGMGIAAEEIPHLFTKFYRIKNVLIQGTNGTGLGLFISKSIIMQHHGKIWVESRPGSGSIFSFSVPLSK